MLRPLFLALLKPVLLRRCGAKCLDVYSKAKLRMIGYTMDSHITCERESVCVCERERESRGTGGSCKWHIVGQESGGGGGGVSGRLVVVQVVVCVVMVCGGGGGRCLAHR